MKKSLVALAVAAALPAFAQAQTNVQLTGSIDMALESVNDDANGGVSDIKVSQGIWAGSRFAIVGSEDLGGGLKALFNIEHRLSPDTGTVTSGAVFWAGQAWAGLGGGFGTIRLGRQYTPMFRALVVGDTTGYSWYNNSVGLAGSAVRFDNEVEYESPRLGGLTLRAAYAPGETYTAATGASNKTGDTFGLSANGAFGPISFGVGYHSTDPGPVGGLDNTTQLGAALGAKFGAFGVGLSYAQNEVDTPTGKQKRKGTFVSTSLGLGAGTIYLVLKRDDPFGNDNVNNGLGLTYSHGLSKRTFMYASVGYNKIDQGAAPDSKPRSIALGVRHFF